MFETGVSLLAAAVTIYVAPNGSATGNGSKEHPLPSISDALRRVRGHEAAHILVAPGNYRVFQPIEVDSNGPLTIEAEDPTRPPVIDGGGEIVGWQVQPNGWWRTAAPSATLGTWTFSDLFVNGQRRERPRMPKQGFYTITEEVPPTADSPNHAYNRFGTNGTEINPNWANRDDVEVVLFHYWHVTTGRIASVDGNTVTLKKPTGTGQHPWNTMPRGFRYFVDNVKEALGTPGQWYLDRQEGTLAYIPLPGETLSNTQVVAPWADHLMTIHGSNVRLSHLKFAHTNWKSPMEGRTFPQSEADLTGAIQISHAANVQLDSCTIEDTGDWGVDISAGCKNVSVNDCTLWNLGAGGIKIGQQGFDDAQRAPTSDCSVTNCVIESFGRRALSACAVWIGESANNVVSHCTVRDGYNSGISVGWSHYYDPSAANHNVIEWNDISNLGQHVTSDMGGIYTLGIQPGTILRNNFIHDITTFSYGGWGVYLDEGSSNIRVENNLVTRCQTAGFDLNTGRDNEITNNIFAFSSTAQLMRTQVGDRNAFNFEHNVVIWDKGVLLDKNWTKNFTIDDNLLWRVGGQPFDFKGQSLQDWRAQGHDKRTVIADPMFVDPLHDDFRFRAGSPVSQVGFKPFDLRGVGSSLSAPPQAANPWPKQ